MSSAELKSALQPTCLKYAASEEREMHRKLLSEIMPSFCTLQPGPEASRLATAM
jgi:hypothetical protein